MKKSKLKIGFVANELLGGFQKSTFNHIKKAVLDVGAELIVFEGRSLNSTVNCDRQHNIIFKFAEQAKVDGFILSLGGIFGFIEEKEEQNWVKHFTHLPCVSINAVISGIPSVISDDEHGLLDLMDHLIGEHGYKDFAFVSGQQLNQEAKRREKAFFTGLKKNNLQFNEKLYIKGDFRPESGVMAISKLAESRHKIDAIIFCNDDMALAAITHARHSFPEFLSKTAITGFDDLPNGQLSSPSLTTIKQSFQNIAYQAVDVVIDQIQNKSVDPVYRHAAELVTRKSCGCIDTSYTHQNFDHLFVYTYNIQENIQSFERPLLFEQLTKSLQQFVSLKSCFVCLYEGGAIEFEEKVELPVESRMVYGYSHGQRVKLSEPVRYKTAEIIPSSYSHFFSGNTTVLKPLFFQQEHFGFIQFEIQNIQEQIIENFRSHLSVMLKGAMLLEERIQADTENTEAYFKIQTLNKRLETLSVTDALTGIYNRRGFYDHTENRVSTSGAFTNHILFAVDIDDLKQINDTWGHGEGDYAIKAIANILRKSFYQQDIIGRIGGDEFLICAKYDSSNETPAILAKLDKNISEFNIYSKKEYKLSLSLGHHVFAGGEKQLLLDAIKKADNELYKSKNNKKLLLHHPPGEEKK